MASAIQVKVCGLTAKADATFAASQGAGYLGFIFHPKSPRYISLEKFKAMRDGLPVGKKVAVVVEPTVDELLKLKAEGFDLFQVHFRHDLPIEAIESWSKVVGATNLWLAPKLPPAVDVPASWAPLASTVLLDTFDPTLFGGTGRTGDWAKFKRHAEKTPDATWILSGGLNPANVADALRSSGARFVDVNSGVESSAGVKDHAKIAAFFRALA
jgi:phosphoribosylanthranilate isomerase